MSTMGHGRARRGGAAYTITEECERLFCETLRAVFLGERSSAAQDSLVTGVHCTNNNNNIFPDDIDVSRVHTMRYPDRIAESESGMPSPEMEFVHVFDDEEGAEVKTWIEVYDYVGGNGFKGFVAEKEGERAMFVFFDPSVIGGDLKAGLMALLELCDLPYFSCSRLVACLDRRTDARALTKDLGWIGFQLTTLAEFAKAEDFEITSDRWLFMDMDV